MSIPGLKVIANPPYCSDTKEMIEKLKNIGESAVFLAPPNAFKQTANEIVDYGLTSGDNFNIALNTLLYAKYENGKAGNKTFEQIVLDKNDLKLYCKVKEYNKSHKCSYEVQYSQDMSSLSETMLKTCWWSASHGYLSEAGSGSKSGLVLVFKDARSKENFKKWAICSPATKFEHKLACRFMLIIRELISGCTGGSTMKTMIPCVDWSREWTDEQILKEIGYED